MECCHVEVDRGVVGRPCPVRVACARSGGQAPQQRAARSIDGSGRAVSRFAVGPAADGHHLSRGFRGRGRLGEGASGCQRRRRGEDGRERAMGSIGGVAGRVPRSAHHAQSKPRLGARHRRRVSGAARRRDGLRAATPPEGAGRRQPQVQRTDESVDAGPRAGAADRGHPAIRATTAGDRHRARAARGGLRAVVQPGRRVRTVAVGCLPARLLPAAAWLLVVAHDRHRHRLGCGHRRDERTVGRRALGRRLGKQQRQHQRQPLQQHQRQPPPGRQQPYGELEPQSGSARQHGLPGRRRDPQEAREQARCRQSRAVSRQGRESRRLPRARQPGDAEPRRERGQRVGARTRAER